MWLFRSANEWKCYKGWDISGTFFAVEKPGIFPALKRRNQLTKDNGPVLIITDQITEP